MKTLSLKLDDKIFEETEEMSVHLKQERSSYIKDALKLYNLFNKRQLLKKQLHQESKSTAIDAMHVLNEFEKLKDGNQTI